MYRISAHIPLGESTSACDLPDTTRSNEQLRTPPTMNSGHTK